MAGDSRRRGRLQGASGLRRARQERRRADHLLYGDAARRRSCGVTWDGRKMPFARAVAAATNSALAGVNLAVATIRFSVFGVGLGASHRASGHVAYVGLWHLDRLESHIVVAAGPVPATPNRKAQSKNIGVAGTSPATTRGEANASTRPESAPKAANVKRTTVPRHVVDCPSLPPVPSV